MLGTTALNGAEHLFFTQITAQYRLKHSPISIYKCLLENVPGATDAVCHAW